MSVRESGNGFLLGWPRPGNGRAYRPYGYGAPVANVRPVIA